jgi:predicted Zn-dependent peptidase
MLNLERKIYNNFNPIGLKEDIEEISYLDCLNFYEKQFQYPSTIINVSKENEFKIDINFQNENINHDFKMGNYKNPLERKNNFKEKVSFIMTSKEINENFGKIKFINQLLANGLNSPLYQEIREKNGLSYFVGAHLSRLNKQAFNTIFTVSTEPHIEKITSLISDIFNNLDIHLTRERFNTIKEYLIIKEKQKDINRYKNVTDWIEPDNFSVKEIINDISYIDVLTIADKYFNMDNYHISRDDKEF